MQLFAKVCSRSCRFLELTEAQTGADRIKKFGVKLPNVVPGSCRNTSKWFWFEWRVFKLVDWLKSRRMDIIQPYTASSQFCKFKATKNWPKPINLILTCSGDVLATMALRGESGWQAVHSKAFGKERWQQSMDRCNMLQHCIVSRYQFQKKTALKHDISSSLSLKSINQHCCPKNTTKK